MSPLNLLGLHSIAVTAYVSISWTTMFSFTMNYAPLLGAFQIKHFYIQVIPGIIPHNTLHCKCVHHFRAACNDKINDCAFKFSVVCK